MNKRMDFNPIIAISHFFYRRFFRWFTWNWRWFINGTIPDSFIPFSSTYCRGHIDVFAVFNIINKFNHPYMMGNVNWLYALALIPGAWIGGKLGAIINQKLPSKTIVMILRIVLILVGIRLIYTGLF